MTIYPRPIPVSFTLKDESSKRIAAEILLWAREEAPKGIAPGEIRLPAALIFAAARMLRHDAMIRATSGGIRTQLVRYSGCDERDRAMGGRARGTARAVNGLIARDQSADRSGQGTDQRFLRFLSLSMYFFATDFGMPALDLPESAAYIARRCLADLIGGTVRLLGQVRP